MLTQDQITQLSPMMRQYLEIKNQHKDHILFFRLGDFYEMFFEDAILVSRELELTLTGKECGLEERAPMCGVPYHSADNYVDRLIKKGYKVAICEQMENPALATGLVKRDIIRVVTPGTLIDSSLLDEGSNNFICCVFSCGDGFGLAFGDVSTGEMNVTQLPSEGTGRVMAELGKFTPSEILFNEELLDKKEITGFIKEKLSCSAELLESDCFSAAAASMEVLRQYQAKNLSDLGLAESPLAVAALGALLSYLRQTQRVGLERMQSVNLYSDKQFMKLDLTARRNLELTETMRSRERRGTLLWVLDRAKTAMGKRLLRSWIEQPLISAGIINRRLNAVEELTGDSILTGRIAERLSGVHDMERLMTKIIYGSAGPRDLTALGATLRRLPGLKDLLEEATGAALQEIYVDIDTLEDMEGLITSSIADDPPVTLKDGGVIRPGYNADLDETRYLCDHTKEIIADMEREERERTGIKSLKVGFNKVFGYYIEVTRSYLDQVPEDYIRRQTLANCERYVTQGLKDLESRVLTAQQDILLMENKLFEEVKTALAAQLSRIQSSASAVARLDVFCSFASVAMTNNYVRPIVDLSDGIAITDGRHPVVEALLTDAPFVPNDVTLGNGEDQIAIITGPNMAGKSTYMRQTALIVLMAQIGSFVPASYAKIGIVDAIYTRVGASDDLASGQSTFMVEMTEVADILKSATAKSLLILDEIGRGTSTFDGMSIARAVLEYIADRKKLGAKTLFATHYHELTDLENIIPCVKNYNVAVKKRGEEITFLRRILPGGADDSYGIEVSKLAGIPRWVIDRAYQVLEELETTGQVSQARINTRAKPREESPQLFFVDEAMEAAKRRIREVNVDAMTPLEALNLLYELKKLVK